MVGNVYRTYIPNNNNNDRVPRRAFRDRPVENRLRARIQSHRSRTKKQTPLPQTPGPPQNSAVAVKYRIRFLFSIYLCGIFFYFFARICAFFPRQPIIIITITILDARHGFTLWGYTSYITRQHVRTIVCIPMCTRKHNIADGQAVYFYRAVDMKRFFGRNIRRDKFRRNILGRKYGRQANFIIYI